MESIFKRRPLPLRGFRMNLDQVDWCKQVACFSRLRTTKVPNLFAQIRLVLMSHRVLAIWPFGSFSSSREV